MITGLVVAGAIMFIGAAVIALSLARIAAIADEDIANAKEPREGPVVALDELGADADGLWREPHRKPGGGWVT